MKYSNEHLALARALLQLSGKTSREVAAECDVTYTNFSSALRGVRSFPETKWPLLMLILGIDRNELEATKVHFWQVGADIEPLQVAIGLLFPNGAQIEGVRRSGGGVWDMRRAMDDVLFALTDGIHRVLIKRTGVGFMLRLNPLPISPETIPQLQLRMGKATQDTMLNIPVTDYGHWDQGNISIEAFDTIWNDSASVATVTWNEVMVYAQRQQITPDQVLDILKSARG